MADLKDVQENQTQQPTGEEPDPAALRAQVTELEQQLAAATQELEQQRAASTQLAEEQLAAATEELEQRLGAARQELTTRADQLGAATQELTARADQLGAATQELEALRAGLGDAQRTGLEHLRRALVAEHAGSIIPELVSGTTPDELAASVDTAKAAHARAIDAARAQLLAQSVPAGNPARSAEDLSTLPAVDKIARGLSRS